MRAFSSAVFCGRKTNKLLKVPRQRGWGQTSVGEGEEWVRCGRRSTLALVR